MREITEVNRKKKMYFLAPEEFKRGEWIKEVPDIKEVDKFDVEYKIIQDKENPEKLTGILTISTLKAKDAR